MTPLRFLGWAARSGLAASADEHAEKLAAPTPSLLGLPAALEIPLDDGSARVPYHLMSADAATRNEEALHALLESVVRQALEAADLDGDALARTQLFMGSSSSEVGLMERAFASDLVADDAAPTMRYRCLIGAVSCRLSRRLDLGLPDIVVDTACTASANALLMAQTALECHDIDHAIIVGLETFNLTTALGFHSLGLLTPSGMRPFDSARNGLVPGEACCALVVSRDGSGAEAAGLAHAPSATASDAVADTGRANFRLLGGASMSDTYSISAANPNGQSIAAVIERALDNACVNARDIRAVKLHGTASLINDEGEAAGMLSVFESLPPLTALKPYVGHTFGASGLLELVMLLGCLERGFWPGLPGVAGDADELGLALLQEPLPLETGGSHLLNQFGFGGNNTSLVIDHAPG